MVEQAGIATSLELIYYMYKTSKGIVIYENIYTFIYTIESRLLPVS